VITPPFTVAENMIDADPSGVRYDTVLVLVTGATTTGVVGVAGVGVTGGFGGVTTHVLVVPVWVTTGIV
jgi:hypothetical protein